jgi:hypothetical protein
MDGTMKLCDFGLAVDTTREKARSRIGTKVRTGAHGGAHTCSQSACDCDEEAASQMK